MPFKKSVCAALAVCLLVLCLSGCGEKEHKQITCEDVAAAYEAAGYAVFHADAAAEDADWLCYLWAEDTDSDEAVYFYFFADPAAAQAYAESRQWNVVLWLYSLAMFNPIWVNAKTYENIAYEYSDSDLIKLFNVLIQ